MLPTASKATSKDGTRIGYVVEPGDANTPAVLLVHGAMQTAKSFKKLASLMAPAFTAIRYDRRGRGESGPSGPDYCLAREVEDVAALLDATSARYVFGLSSGAIIALAAALELPQKIEQVALYEPPLAVGDVDPGSWSDRFLAMLDREDIGGAMALIIKATGDRELFTAIPRPLLAFAFRAILKREPVLRELVPTVKNDIAVQREGSRTLPPRLGELSQRALLLGGEISAATLPPALDLLQRELPRARRLQLPGVGHIAADDHGKPSLVAKELRAFFS